LQKVNAGVDINITISDNLPPETKAKKIKLKEQIEVLANQLNNKLSNLSPSNIP